MSSTFLTKFFASVILTFGIFSIVSQPVQAAYSPRVLMVGIDPTDGSGASLANTYFTNQMGGKTAAQFEAEFAQQTITDFKELSQDRIQYVLAGQVRFTDFPSYPNGYQFTVQNYAECVWGNPAFNPTKCETQKQLFPYGEYFQQHELCEKAAEVNADEIWIFSPPYILAWEAFMVGPTDGYWVNGPTYILPTCTKHYVVVNGAYDTPNNFLHSYGHRVEATIDYLMRNFSVENRTNYWERFAGRNPSTRSSGAPFCGNVHFPHNFRNEYDIGNPASKVSTCPDFANFPNYSGQTVSVGCAAWGCTDRGWQKYWFASIPHSNGTVSITNILAKTYQFKKDWWYYILYPENALISENESAAVRCTGDINNDQKVDLADYSILVSNFLKTVLTNPKADLNGDEKVNLQDYSILVSKFLKPCS